MLYATFKTQGACCHEIEAGKGHEDAAGPDLRMSGGQGKAESGEMCAILWYNSTQVLNENARKPLSIGYLAFSLCSDILAALSVF